ncbi:MAG: hypothetical protein HOW73_19850 [Polyangiaceae bacterium]|nr:hypothetical protein [Polyangiaceae bacterium]
MSTRLAAAALLALGCNQILGTEDYSVRGDGGSDSGGGVNGGGVTNGGGDEGGSGGSGGGAMGCDAPADQKPVVTVEGEITADVTLSCDRTYKLTGEVFVEPGAKITVEAGTTIFGDKTTGAALVVMPGAQIIANGTADRPIVFTSAGGEFADPGDWGGVVILGRAPINQRDANGNPTQGQVEGILDTANAAYGGDDAEDSSGSLRYVRIEYGGKAIAPNNELNGLTLAGVGRGTSIDHIMVRQTTDDCFEFFGGTVDAKYLLCQAPGDDGIDWDNGYGGRLQFVVVQQDPSFPMPGDMNGLEGDNDAAGSANTPLSEPTLYNITLCGQNYTMGQQYGALLRKNTQAHLLNAFVSGFEAGVDLRDAGSASIEIRSSRFFGNTLLAYDEMGGAPYNDDDGLFDEIAFLNDAANQNSFDDPNIPGCNDMETLALAPAEPLVDGAAAPPDDGFFDAEASYIGAFRDPADDWATGAWVSWKLQ